MTKGVFVDLRLNEEHVSSAWANFCKTYAVYGSVWDKNPDGAITQWALLDKLLPFYQVLYVVI